jgi:hypothetical protein
MAVERVTRAGARPLPAMGMTAQLADAMGRLRGATPRECWEDVQEEVRRLQRERAMSRLAALNAVYAKVADGWTPPRHR